MGGLVVKKVRSIWSHHLYPDNHWRSQRSFVCQNSQECPSRGLPWNSTSGLQSSLTIGNVTLCVLFTEEICHPAPGEQRINTNDQWSISWSLRIFGIDFVLREHRNAWSWGMLCCERVLKEVSLLFPKIPRLSASPGRKLPLWTEIIWRLSNIRQRRMIIISDWEGIFYASRIRLSPRARWIKKSLHLTKSHMKSNIYQSSVQW